MAFVKTALLIALLAVGGCSSSKSISSDAAYRERQMCQSTAIGSDTKRVCY